MRGHKLNKSMTYFILITIILIPYFSDFLVNLESTKKTKVPTVSGKVESLTKLLKYHRRDKKESLVRSRCIFVFTMKNKLNTLICLNYIYI